MRVVLATILLNEAEFLPRLVQQHEDWPGLVGWVFVEGACADYAKANPGAVSRDGLSTDSTTADLDDVAAANPRVLVSHYGFARGAGGSSMGEQKRQLRNEYCRIIDERYVDADLVICIDADEFYTKAHQAEISRVVTSQGWDDDAYDSWCFPLRDVWHNPAMQQRRQPRFAREVRGGYFEIPHTKVWRWEAGAGYGNNHCRLARPSRRKAPPRLWKGWTDKGAATRAGLPTCVHMGFARAPQHRLRTNAFYVERGEGREASGTNRQMYVDCRSSWETWDTGTRLPHGLRVVDYDGPVPECFMREVMQGA